MIGQTINNYLLERKIGEGGMGNVYFARHNRIDRVVAIKVLHQNLFANEAIRNRFKNEANALIKLIHPNIVKIYDYVEQEDYACLIIEYIDGLTLDEYITKVTGPLPAAKATAIMCEILDAVQFAHEHSIFHRDIKPGNIMVSHDGKTIRIMDFGIAKLADSTNLKVTHSNAQLGTPFYMSPEQVKGLPYTIHSDVYSLGVTLFEMVTGRCPYTEITNLFELQNKIVNDPLPPANNFYPGVTAKMQEAISIATQKIPAQRFRSCKEFKKYLLQEERPVVAEKPEPKAKPKPVIPLPLEESLPEPKPATPPRPKPVPEETGETNTAYPWEKRKKPQWIAYAVALAACCIGGFFIYRMNKVKPGGATGSGTTIKVEETNGVSPRTDTTKPNPGDTIGEKPQIKTGIDNPPVGPSSPPAPTREVVLNDLLLNSTQYDQTCTVDYNESFLPRSTGEQQWNARIRFTKSDGSEWEQWVIYDLADGVYSFNRVGVPAMKKAPPGEKPETQKPPPGCAVSKERIAKDLRTYNIELFNGAYYSGGSIRINNVSYRNNKQVIIVAIPLRDNPGFRFMVTYNSNCIIVPAECMVYND